jgi:hypothetical protein
MKFEPNQLVIYTNPDAMPGPWKDREGKIATFINEESDAGFDGGPMARVHFNEERNPVRCYVASLKPYVAG